MLSERRLESYLKLSEIIQYSRQNPLWFVENFLGIELLDYQKYVFMRTWNTPFVVWTMSRSAGKALALDTPIPTPDGYKTMGKLKVGDYVLDENGEPTKITYTSDTFTNNKCYKMTFSDGEEIVADANHLWNFVTRRNVTRTVKTEDMVKDYKRLRNKKNIYDYKYRVPRAQPIKYEVKELPIDPYLLGYWLGDGHSSCTRITCDYEDIEEIIGYIEDKGYETRLFHNKDGAPHFNVGMTPKGQDNKLLKELQKLNLIKNKHIPYMYIYSSIEQRQELLRGIMDADGSIDRLGRVEFSQKKYHLINEISKILLSLGIDNNVREKPVNINGETVIYYRINFVIDKTNNIFKLKRKRSRVKESLSRKQYKYVWEIEEVKSVPTKCISVENPSELYLCGDRFTVTHNTTLGSLYIMARGMLFPNFQTYILAGTGSQSQEMFMKIESIAMQRIASFTGLTDIFANETVKSSTNKTGFTHSPQSFETTLYNGSRINSLNSVADNIRSKRSNLNFYDESGFTSDELFEASEPFAVQNSDFRLGGGVDSSLLPKQMPNQLIYASSASATDTYFFQKYKDFSKKMFLGDPNFFVADINSDVVINATFNGKILSTPLLSQETVDAARRNNQEKAMREYGNIFTSEGSDQQIIKRATIVRNSELRLPVLSNPNDKQRKFVIAVDPARSYDNSVAVVAELIDDPDVGYRMDIVNSISFSDLKKKKKTPMQTPEQIKKFKEVLIGYNGARATDYENIDHVLIDSGAGGGGISAWADGLLESWTDSSGRKRMGIIDKENEEYKIHAPKYSEAKDILTLVSPSKYKKDLFASLIEMMGQDLITFPENYDGKGELVFTDTTKESGKTHSHVLTDDEIMALINMDLIKEELVSIYEFPSSNGNVRYELAPDKKNKMNDDRAYATAMLAWYLQKLRRLDITKEKEVNSEDYMFFMSSI